MRGARAITALFAVTAFFGAGMLFLVQPMIARLLLPSYGGSATVWSTSSLFFQVVLLLGYVYTDRATRIRRKPDCGCCMPWYCWCRCSSCRSRFPRRRAARGTPRPSCGCSAR